MKLKNRRIGFCITGSFCTLETVLPYMEQLIAAGADLMPIFSYAVASIDTRFTTAAAFRSKVEALTGKEVIDTIPGAEPIGPKKLLDLIIIAPCTGNTLAKLANAITDTPVLMAAKAHLRNGRPVLLSISTNDGLSANAKNLGLLLNAKNIFWVPFYQDGPDSKSNSLTADLDRLKEAAEKALEGKQIESVILEKRDYISTGN